VSVVIIIVGVKITLRVENTLCVWKLHSACRNHTHTYQNHTLVHVQITVVSVVITFVRVKITFRVEIKLCVYKSHFACENRTLRVKITLCV
jgi:heme/copper-type cytochrome/quinol oxidase subunit 2